MSVCSCVCSVPSYSSAELSAPVTISGLNRLGQVQGSTTLNLYLSNFIYDAEFREILSETGANLKWPIA